MGVVRARMVAMMMSISSLPSYMQVSHRVVQYGQDLQTALRPSASAAYPVINDEKT